MTQWGTVSIVRATLPLLLVLTVVEVGSGLVLGSFEGTLIAYPALLVLVPVTIGTAGTLGAVLASRLATAFHLGTLSLSVTDPELVGNAVAITALAVSVFPAVGGGAWVIAAVTVGTDLSVVTVVSVAFLSGTVLAGLAVVVTVVTTYAAHRLGLDPDDVVVPIVTNTCDVLGVVVLFAVVHLVVAG